MQAQLFIFPERTSAVAQSLSLIAQQKRVALVIGNATYEESPLLNPVNDATAMAEKLRQLGFEVMSPVIDADLEEMERIWRK